MSVKELGSLLLKGVYRDINLKSSLERIKSLLVSTKGTLSNVTVEMFRMTKQSGILGIALGAIGIGGFASLLSMMPRVNSQLRLAKTYLNLIAIELDDNVSPAAEWATTKMEDLYNLIRDSPEWIQTGVAGLGLLSLTALPALIAGFLSGKLSVASFMKVLGSIKTAAAGAVGWLSGIATSIWSFISASAAAQIAAGLLLGVLAVFALDRAGVLDWISELTQGFRDARDDGDLLANAITLILGPLALLGDAILVLIGSKTWSDFKNDLEVIKDSFITLRKSVSDFYRELRNVRVPDWMGTARSYLGMGVHAVGGQATYTGWHWLESGETVNPRGISGSGGGSGNGSITIENNFTGNIVLNNGMDMDEFVEENSRRQAQKLAWRSF